MYCEVIHGDEGYELDFNSTGNSTMERQQLYCVPVPGESQWARDAYQMNSNSSSSAAPRADPSMSVPLSSSSSTGRKRGRSEEEEGVCVEMAGEGSSQEDTVDQSHKKLCSNADFNAGPNAAKSSSSAACLSVKDQESFLNLPLPERDPPVIVKVYGPCQYKVNEVVEFVGVFIDDPQLAFVEVDEADAWMVAEEAAVHHPPTSRVPRLHAVLHEKVVEGLGAATFSPLYEVASLRYEVLETLKSILGDDPLAAEYVLLNLISTVQFRKDSLPIGILPLNISKVSNKDIFTALDKLISQILPKRCVMSLSCKMLNSRSLLPTKDYNQDRLITSPLQLTNGTHLLINELTMDNGRLQYIGLQNLGALTKLTSEQVLPYDFVYYKTPFDTDLVPLVISEGSSLLKVEALLPLVNGSKCNEELMDNLMSKVDECRRYFAAARGWFPKLHDEVLPIIEKDFADMRSRNPKLLASDLNRMITIARLLTASYGEECVSKSHWVAARDMERSRMERVELSTANANAAKGRPNFSLAKDKIAQKDDMVDLE
jgi:hypothetical protein